MHCGDAKGNTGAVDELSARVVCRAEIERKTGTGKSRRKLRVVLLLFYYKVVQF